MRLEELGSGIGSPVEVGFEAPEPWLGEDTQFPISREFDVSDEPAEAVPEGTAPFMDTPDDAAFARTATRTSG